MKIIVFGANGMLGNYVCQYLSESYQVIACTRKDYDIISLTHISLLEFLSPKIRSGDIIINCAGAIPQTAKTKNVNTKKYFLINTCFPIICGNICQELNCKFIHITTDCVFSGKIGNYDELSEHDETSAYGASKSLGELAMATIIRTSIIGEEKRNKKSLLEWLKSNQNGQVDGFTNHWWNGVTCLELAKIIYKLIADDALWQGVRHIHSPEPINKYNLLKLLNKHFQLNVTISPQRTEIVNKTLSSNYSLPIKIQKIEDQISELNKFNLT